jgi:transposase
MSKLTDEDKVEIIRHYLTTNEGFRATAEKFGLHKSTVRLLVDRYIQNNIVSIIKKKNHYDTKFKVFVLNYQRKQNLSNNDTCAMFNIPTTSLLRNWQKKYSEGGYKALDSDKRGAPKKMQKKEKEQTLNEKTELERLREENEYLRMENEILKKLRALIQKEEKSGLRQKQKS